MPFPVPKEVSIHPSILGSKILPFYCLLHSHHVVELMGVPYKLCIALQSYQLWCARLAASACQWEYQDKLLPARQLDSDAVAGRKTGGFCQTCQHCHHLSYLSNLLSNHETKDILTEISMFKINLISKCVLSFQKMFGLYERSLTDKQEKMELLSL